MGLGFYEAIVILVFLVVASIMAGFVWLGRRSELKTCPHCAERIKPAAKLCRYCQRDVAGVGIENKAPRGLFSD